jgi:hypothetical protein
MSSSLGQNFDQVFSTTDRAHNPEDMSSSLGQNFDQVFSTTDRAHNPEDMSSNPALF